MQVAVFRAVAFSLFFLLLTRESVHAQAQSAASPEAQSPFSALAAWLDHLTRPGVPPHRRAASPTPLPRPKPAELNPAPAASNKPAPVPLFD
jgi:hypothetical protein